jgi:sugar phosphate isomerase/epimerase
MRKQLQENFLPTLEVLRKIGFTVYEPMILPIKMPVMLPPLIWTMDDLASQAACLQAVGFAVPSAHIIAKIEQSSFIPTEMAQTLKQIHVRLGITHFVFGGMFETTADAKVWGEYLHTLQDLLKIHGLQVLYHNHDVEFSTICVDGISMTAMDYFLSFAGKDVLLELDIGWARFAVDDVSLAQKYADRIAILHMKDFIPQVLNHSCTRDELPAAAFTPIGVGAVRTKEVLHLTESMPCFIGLSIIDQDQSATPTLEELQTGYRFLHTITTEQGESQ